MYERTVQEHMRRFALIIVGCMTIAPLGAAVWNGGPIPGSVTDVNLQITNTFGDNTIAFPNTNISVNASTTNVVVDVLAPSVIKSASLGATLCFNAAPGFTIDVNLGANLTLERGIGIAEPFLVKCIGDVRFHMVGGTFVILTDEDPVPANQLGTRLVLVMQDPGDAPISRIIFDRQIADPFTNLPMGVLIFNASLMSYVAETPVASGAATEVGTIQFGSNTPLGNNGYAELFLGDRCSFIISGHRTANATCGMLNSDIDFATPAGLNASLIADNNAPFNPQWSAFIVSNTNTTYNSSIGPNPSSLLINPFCVDQLYDTTAYTGLLYGFILQANGSIVVNDGAYMLYSASSANVSPLPFTPVSCNRLVSAFVKERNPAALIVDGNPDENAIPASITLNGTSGLYLAANSNCFNCPVAYIDGTSGNFVACQDAGNEVGGAGITVMSVEGDLNVFGNAQQGAINVLSLVVNLQGGSVLNEQGDNRFPLRNYSTWSDGTYQRFPRGAIMVRATMRLNQTNLKHDDLSHRAAVKFLPGNFLLADPEPTYIGSEGSIIIPANTCAQFPSCPNPLVNCPGGARTIELINSNILAHSNLASSGLTFLVPSNDGSGDPVNNTSNVFLYSNGNCFSALDGTQRTGVTFTIGSRVGAVAADGSRVLDPNAYIDIFQTADNEASTTQVLNFYDRYNNNKFLPGLTGYYPLQFAVHTIAQLYGSNISIGTDTTQVAPPFFLTTLPTLSVTARYVNFLSQGGALQDPSSSGSTGQGGIFVDTNGTFQVDPNVQIAFNSVTIAKSYNVNASGTPGRVILPDYQTFYGAGAGIQQWNLDMNQSAEVDVVPLGTTLSNYTLDWLTTLKTFCAEDPYVPYFRCWFSQLLGTYLPARLVPVTQPNLGGASEALPTVKGYVDGQFQIKNSRIGDQAQLIVHGGNIREVVFLKSDTQGAAPMGTIIIEDDGIVGLGTANLNVDSLYADIVLGVNGVTLLANGDGQVRLNQDVLINDYCHILTGPSFGLGTAQQLLITSEVPREIRVKKNGVLDLSQFTNYNQRLAIGGQVTLVFEPGAQLLLGEGELFFLGDAQMIFEPFVDFNFPTPSDPSGTDPYRVQISNYPGTGNPARLTFKERSRMFIPRGALVGVQSIHYVSPLTNQSWLITDAARIEVGNATQYGGGLQIGNTRASEGTSVQWALIIDGLEATFEVNGQGFFGIGYGIVNKPNLGPNSWSVGSLSNVANVSITINEGIFTNQTLYPGTDVNASLIALAADLPSISVTENTVNSRTLGGGNVVILPGSTSSIIPAVDTAVTYGSYAAGILASTYTLSNKAVWTAAANPVTVSGVANVFNFLVMDQWQEQTQKSAVIVPKELGVEGVGFVLNNTIWRQISNKFYYGSAGIGPNAALEIGAAGISSLDQTITPPAVVLAVINP